MVSLVPRGNIISFLSIGVLLFCATDVKADPEAAVGVGPQHWHVEEEKEEEDAEEEICADNNEITNLLQSRTSLYNNRAGALSVAGNSPLHVGLLPLGEPSGKDDAAEASFSQTDRNAIAGHGHDRDDDAASVLATAGSSLDSSLNSWTHAGNRSNFGGWSPEKFFAGQELEQRATAAARGNSSSALSSLVLRCLPSVSLGRVREALISRVIGFQKLILQRGKAASNSTSEDDHSGEDGHAILAEEVGGLPKLLQEQAKVRLDVKTDAKTTEGTSELLILLVVPFALLVLAACGLYYKHVVDAAHGHGDDDYDAVKPLKHQQLYQQYHHGQHQGSSREQQQFTQQYQQQYPQQYPHPSSAASLSESGTWGGYLCPELVVPRGSECVLAVPALISRRPSLDIEFDVRDTKGNPVLRAQTFSLGSPTPTDLVIRGQTQPTIVLRATHPGSVLAYCSSTLSSTEAHPMFYIYRQDGELFAYLQREERNERYGPAYVLKIGNGGQMFFYGVYAEHAINVWDNEQRELLAAVEGASMDFDYENHYYKVRVAPNVDAGLILCSLLGIDKMEVNG